MKTQFEAIKMIHPTTKTATMEHFDYKMNLKTRQYTKKLSLSQVMSKDFHMEQHYTTNHLVKSKAMFSTFLKRPSRQLLLPIISFLIFSLPLLVHGQQPIWVVDEHNSSGGLHMWQYTDYTDHTSGIDYGRLKYIHPTSGNVIDLGDAGEMEAMAINTYTGIAFFLSNNQISGGPSGTQALFQYDLLQAPNNIGDIRCTLIGHITKPTGYKMECLTFDPTTNRFYAADHRDNAQNSSSTVDILYYIDMSSLNPDPMVASNPTAIGLVQGLGKYNKYVDGLECDDNGVMYAIDGVNDELHRINPATGAIIGVEDANLGGDFETISWDPITNKMIGIDNSAEEFVHITLGSNGSNTTLMHYDLTSGIDNNADFEGSAMININGPTMSIGNLVYRDNNNNGTYDLGEGVDGVRVELFLASADPQNDIPIHTLITSGGGFYHFTTLVADNYVVHIPNTEFGGSKPLQNYVSMSGVGSDNRVDDDDNGIDQAFPTSTGISSASINLANNAEPINSGTETGAGNTIDDSDDNNGDMTIDFAFSSVIAPPPGPPTTWTYDCQSGDSKCVEIVGIGTEGQGSKTMNLDNSNGDIHLVVLEAIFKNGTPPASMNFVAGGTNSKTGSKEDIYSAGKTPDDATQQVRNNQGAYRVQYTAAELAAFGGTIPVTLNVPNGSQNSTWSFVAYIHRNTPQASHYCTGRYMQEYFYHGSTGAGPFVRTYTIPSTGAGTTKDIDVTIPVAEMTDDSRQAIITVTAGSKSHTWTIQSPSQTSSYANTGAQGHALNILTTTLTGVAGTVTSFTVSTTSPSGNGDSFITGGSVVSVNNVCQQVENCLVNGDEDGDGFVDCADSDCSPVINSVTPQDPTCNGNSIDGSITVNATQAPNGSTGIQYCLTTSASGTSSCVWQNSNIFNGLSGGTNYYVWVKDNSTTCEVAYTSNPVVLTTPNCGGCTSPTELAHWDMDACDYDNFYDEFTAAVPNGVCLTMSNIRRNKREFWIR